MHICLTRLSALSLIRWLRSSYRAGIGEPCGIPAADPWPQRRWSARLIPYQQLGRTSPPSASSPVDVIVPDGKGQPRASFFSVRTCDGNLPPGSFIQATDEYTVPCPELLFLELAGVMTRDALALVGYELCGTYARDPGEPRTGAVTHGVEQLTNVGKIAAYLSRCEGMRYLRTARATLRDVRDGAWSAMEAIVALLLVRGVDELGYGVGDVSLNERETFGHELSTVSAASSRVPDVSLADLPVGFNYDGHGHLDLKSINVSSSSKAQLRDALSLVRGKYVDDLRRNRELLAQGRIVMPIVSEDLLDWGGLDAAVLEAILAAERLTGTSGAVGEQVRRSLRPDLAAKRQQLIWSLYPWSGGRSLGAY